MSTMEQVGKRPTTRQGTTRADDYPPRWTVARGSATPPFFVPGDICQRDDGAWRRLSVDRGGALGPGNPAVDPNTSGSTGTAHWLAVLKTDDLVPLISNSQATADQAETDATQALADAAAAQADVDAASVRLDALEARADFTVDAGGVDPETPAGKAAIESAIDAEATSRYGVGAVPLGVVAHVEGLVPAGNADGRASAIYILMTDKIAGNLEPTWRRLDPGLAVRGDTVADIVIDGNVTLGPAETARPVKLILAASDVTVTLPDERGDSTALREGEVTARLFIDNPSGRTITFTTPTPGSVTVHGDPTSTLSVTGTHEISFVAASGGTDWILVHAGIAGPSGADGADGADGATGPVGPPGAAGADGADGADGQDCLHTFDDNTSASITLTEADEGKVIRLTSATSITLDPVPAPGTTLYMVSILNVTGAEIDIAAGTGVTIETDTALPDNGWASAVVTGLNRWAIAGTIPPP